MISDAQHDFAALLRLAREKAGLTRDQLAKRVGLDVSHLFRIETGGRNPSRDSALALAVALEIDDAAVNQWLGAAGYAPIPALGVIREAVRSRGTVRTRGSGHSRTQSAGSVGWDASAQARRLEAIGLTEGNLARLLESMSTGELAAQQEAARAVSGAFTRVAEMLESPMRAAVIPAAGGQHRLLATHVMQRLLLGAIREATQAGIRNIVLVLAPGSGEFLYGPLKEALELAVVPIIQLHCCEQPTPNGLGDAVLRTEAFVGKRPFAVLLPDDVVRESAGRLLSRELPRMIRAFNELKDASLVAVGPVPKAKLVRCGAARLGTKELKDGILPILELAERPNAVAPITNARNVKGIVGRYVLQSNVFTALHELKKRIGHRLELTDALALLLSQGARVCAYEIVAKRQDLGAVLDEAQDLIGRSS